MTDRCSKLGHNFADDICTDCGAAKVKLPLYFVYADLRDGCSMLPTTREPMPLKDVGTHIEQWLSQRLLANARYQEGGYISNCRKERLQPADIEWRVGPYEEDDEARH